MDETERSINKSETNDSPEDAENVNAAAEAEDKTDEDEDDALLEDDVSAIRAAQRKIPSPAVARLTYSAYAEMRPSPASKYAPMEIWGYIALLFFTAIPVAGFIAAVVVALVSKKLARKRLATAVVILRAVLFALLAAAAIVAVAVFHVDLAAYVSGLI